MRDAQRNYYIARLLQYYFTALAHTAEEFPLSRERVVAFLFRTRMFIFTKRFPVTHTRNRDHPHLGFITPKGGRVKGVS